MSKNSIINCSIEITDELLASVKVTDKGRKFLNFSVGERKSVSQYGHTHALSLSRTKEEREAGVAIKYIGDGKEVAFGGKPQVAQAAQEDPDDLPF